MHHFIVETKKKDNLFSGSFAAHPHKIEISCSMTFSREQQSQSQSQQQQRSQNSQLSSYASVLERSASAHVYAQKLNNVAAMYIEVGVGHYDKAISSLGKALRLSELHIVDQLMDRSQACTCYDCSLDGCITFSEESNNNKNHSNLLDLCNQNKNKNKSDIKNMMFMDGYYDQEEGGSEHTTITCTIYQSPIRIPPRSIAEGHNMGSTLFLIITFNLALAHHLKAVSMLSSSTSSTLAVSSVSSLIANTLQFYELTNNWQHRLSCEDEHEEEEEEEEEEDDHEDDHDYDYDYESDDDDNDDDDSIITIETTYEEEEETFSRNTAAAAASPVNNMNTTTYHSVRFNMILCNNLSHLHRLMKNDTMSKQCLEHLLSTVMLAIDQNKNNNTEQQQPQPQQHLVVDDDDIEFEYYDDEDDQQSQLQLHVQPPSSRFIDVQGFVQNTTSLILQDQCADAA